MEFTQPNLNDPGFNAPAKVIPDDFARNIGGNDELTSAVAAQRNRGAVVMPEPEKLPGKYRLDYMLKGEPIRETHATLPLALQAVARLKKLNIHPVTSTVE